MKDWSGEATKLFKGNVVSHILIIQLVVYLVFRLL
jgi:hypothetical protein